MTAAGETGADEGVEVLPMFPLGMVLLPHMSLPLRIFEPRYKQMLADIASHEAPEFGVVLIERGHEVGGGDQRFPVGTVARVVGVSGGMGVVSVAAVSGRRIEVREWLADDPYPRARVRTLPDLEGHSPDLLSAELEVRAALDLAAEVGTPAWPANVELADDPSVAVWQLAAVAPLGPLDHLDLLRAGSATELVERLRSAVAEAVELLAARRGGRLRPD